MDNKQEFLSTLSPLSAILYVLKIIHWPIAMVIMWL